MLENFFYILKKITHIFETKIYIFILFYYLNKKNHNCIKSVCVLDIKILSR